MFFRGFRRSLYSKIILLILVLLGLFYLKFMSLNELRQQQNHQPAAHERLVQGQYHQQLLDAAVAADDDDAVDGDGNNKNNEGKVGVGKTVVDYRKLSLIIITNKNDLGNQILLTELGIDNALAKRYEQMIKLDYAKQVNKLGDNGKPVTLTGHAKDIGDKQLAVIALNEELSEHLSYNRTTPDARNPLCRNQQYDLNNLPTASVVVIFFNEPYSVLVRTIYSVINTADQRILKEIILVDDCSTNDELKGKLDYFVATRLSNIVKIIRLKNRLGLIRARLAGARLARGGVIVFLDAHCEGVVGWLEPLLKRIKESPTSVLVPIIDVIDAKDFHYSVNGYRHFQVGGFNWNGHFDWIDISSDEKKRIQSVCNEEVEICPTYSPTMAGGLFAIDRDYFWDVGSYDEQMDGWGGENLEMSFRIWQCGGTIETIPCSRVGHIFRDFHPYQFPDNRDTHGINTARMAMVWMDEYIDLLFMNRPDLKNHPEIGDITHRRLLRSKLKCKNFEWYLKNIYPQKFIPNKNVQQYGRVQADSQNLCLDDLQKNNEEPYSLGVYQCHKPEISRSQFFSLTNYGVLRNEISCATVQQSSSVKKNIIMAPCLPKDRDNERWEITDNQQIRHIEENICLDHRNLSSQSHLYASPCDSASQTQRWKFVH